MIKLVEWDTVHFEMKVGEIVSESAFSLDSLSDEIKFAKKECYDVLYLKGAKLPEEYLSDNIVLADEKVIYSQTVRNRQSFKDDCVLSILHKELDARLLSMALQSGGYSRYYTDKKFPLSVFLSLYETWITDSLNGSIATDVIAFVENRTVEGFITYKQIEDNFVEIGLVDVDKSVKGKGIGSRLMQSFLSMFPVGTKISVATQLNNSPACHFYEKNGFSVESITNIYHIWL